MKNYQLIYVDIRYTYCVIEIRSVSLQIIELNYKNT